MLLATLLHSCVVERARQIDCAKLQRWIVSNIADGELSAHALPAPDQTLSLAELLTLAYVANEGLVMFKRTSKNAEEYDAMFQPSEEVGATETASYTKASMDDFSEFEQQLASLVQAFEAEPEPDWLREVHSPEPEAAGDDDAEPND